MSSAGMALICAPYRLRLGQPQDHVGKALKVTSHVCKSGDHGLVEPDRDRGAYDAKRIATPA